MQQESFFSVQLRKYLTMGIKIWPSLRVGIRHITDITGTHQHSLLPSRIYNTMTPQLFLQTITNDMHQFIMQHDVKQEDIQDYFNDILDLLNIDQDLTLSNGKLGSVRYMARQVIKVIDELQNGKTQTIDKFQNNVYNPVIQMGVGDAVQQGGQDSEDDQQMDQEGDDSQGDYSDQEEQNQIQQEGEGNKQKTQKKQSTKQNQKTEQQLKKQQQLQDDGWVIVKKKK